MPATRMTSSVGLTRARLAGARYATADALVFLDAHCEGQPDWLRPLLQRMKDAPNAVVMPIIDVIDSGNMYYSVADTTFFQVGGFNFMGHFTWIDVPEREKKRRGSDIGATWSPTMAGGLFAINREYYWELGAYDEQMAGWGGENLEMSFRIWQCGGTLETIPCSRVGHVFRAFHPYGMPAHTDTHGINTARMAEVWMDDYKELFYLHRPDLRKNPKIGDVTHRKILREKLQCKSFEWYLQHIYKEKFVPVRDAFGYGRFRNVASGLCLDTLQREADAAPLGVYPCHPTLQGTQYLSLALDGILRDEERCVQLQYNRETDADSNEGRKLLLVGCNRKLKEQKWRYTSNKQLIHMTTGLCLDSGFEAVVTPTGVFDVTKGEWYYFEQDKTSSGGKELETETEGFGDDSSHNDTGADVVAKKCKSGAPTQRWEIDYNEHNGFRLSEDREPSEAELTLQKLRGQRRISRSLMSADSDNSTTTNKIRRHSHKKKKHKKGRKKTKRTHSKTKNKFILQLVRTLMNNSEDHLEVDIHCKHRQLYPNNTFVRDLVTILNERNIKVINNGRVFERNRVTELVRDPTTMRQTETKVLKKLEVSQGTPPANNPPPQPQPQPITPIQQVQSAKQIQYMGLSKPMELSKVARAVPDHPTTIDRWLNKKRRLKMAAVPMPTAEGISPINDEEQMVYNQQDANDALADKKIIIEDFVEVKTPAITPEPYINRAQTKHPSKKRKKKLRHHRKTEHQQHTEQVTDKPEDEQHPAPKLRTKEKQMVSIQHEYDEDAGDRPDSEQRQGSVEKITSVASQETKHSQHKNILDVGDRESNEQDDDGHDSEWSTATEPTRAESLHNSSSIFRRSNVQLEEESDTGEGTESSAYQPSPDELPQTQNASSPHFRNQHDKPPAPLKVVMKSNLTFNLGDEFFKWRSTDDVTDLLGDLAIPSNSSRATPPLHAWVKPAPRPAVQPTARDGGQSFRSDALLTAHGMHQASKGEGKEQAGGASLQAVDDNSQSSSSESEERIDKKDGGRDGFY